MAIITSPENHRKLERLKTIARRLALAEDVTTEAEARALAAEGTAVVWIDGGLHANETLGAQQLIETVYQLVSSTDQEVTRILDNVVVPADQVQAEALRMAAEIAANAPLAVTSAKRMMRMGLEETFPTHVQHVYLQLLPLFASDDFQEGIKSFLEKRPAQFTGR